MKPTASPDPSPPLLQRPAPQPPPARRQSDVPPWLGPVVLLATIAVAAMILLRSPFVASLLALDAPFAPVPDPASDDLAEPSFANAVRVSAPLLIGAYLLVSGFICDALARRQFDYSGTVDRERPGGYLAVAVLLVFPQVLLAAPALAWGVYNLIRWATINDAVAPAGWLVALLAAGSAAGLALARNRGVWPRNYVGG